MVFKQNQQCDGHLEKKQSKFISILSTIFIFCIIMFLAKYFGRQTGKSLAMQEVQQESIAQNAPTGFMGAKWLMPMSQIKSLFPDAFEIAPGKLMLDTTAFNRSAFVGFDFTDNMLLMIIITFKGEKTENTYKQIQDLIEDEYGIFTEPTSTNKQILYSKKIIERIAIEHVLYKQDEIPIEQVVLYRNKNNYVH